MFKTTTSTTSTSFILFKSINRYFFKSSSFENLIRNELLSINDEVKYALKKQHPIVALESTILTHGLPYPDNVNCAIDVENVIRQKGVIPATIAILNGVIKVGLTKDELELIGNVNKSKPIKTSRRDFPFVISQKLNGGTTVSGTLIIANKLNIPIFATGGIGGVHRDGENTFDISADLIELGKSKVAVVSSGVKSILDIPKTLEYLETQGVFVGCYGDTKDFPAFYCKKSGCQVPYSILNPKDGAKLILANINLNLKSGMLFGVPVPDKYALNEEIVENAINKAMNEAKKYDIRGKQITPFLLRKIWEITHGKSLLTNIELVKNNASVAADIAVELEKLRNGNKNDNEIVVIGGSNLDLCAKVEDGEIKLDGRMHPSKLKYVAGGVGRNIWEALIKLGKIPKFLTAIAEDEPGKLLKTMIPDIINENVKIIDGKNTAQCVIVLDNKGDCTCLLADLGIHQEITPEVIIQNEALITKAKLIVIDANLSIESIEEILKVATENEIPVFFEPTDVIVSSKPFETSYYKAIKFITPNTNELQYIAEKLNIKTPKKLENMKDISETAKKLVEYIDNVIVTLGSDGVLIARKSNATQPFLNEINEKNVQIRHYAAEKIDGIINVSGAGDCFASGFIVSMLKGLPEEICVSVGFSAAKYALKSSKTVSNEMFNENHPSFNIPAKYVSF